MNLINTQILNGSGDLVDLLDEAKSTILQLQEEIKSLRSEIDTLRQKNLEFVNQMDQLKNNTNIVPFNNDHNDDSNAMPLELIIMKQNEKQKHSKCEYINNTKDVTNNTVDNVKAKAKISNISSPSEQTPSDNTFLM